MFNELNNNNRTIKEGIDTRKMNFRPLKDFVGQRINVDGFIFTEGKYGKQVVVVGNGCLINMPARAVEVFETIAHDNVMLKAVLDGKLALTEIEPIETKNGTTTTYTLTDV